jgi:sortase B
VERVELAPLVFVPAFIITIYIFALIASAFHKPDEPVREITKDAPSGIQVSNMVASNVSAQLEEDDLLFGVKTVEDMLPNLREYYEKNSDIVGWLKVDDMVIDYPVMQTPENEDYYLDRDFDKNESSAGSLIMDTDSVVGDGTLANEYKDGTKPSTNLIIHGHNMRNGSMFGDLDKYRKQDFEKSHSIIKFSSLYEEREYEIVSVFLSQVYRKDQDVFKYYKFFEANTKEEFDDFYKNIKKLQLYDTGVTAEFGDEFITLSVCAYHVENGRLVVVGKRIK